jgi:lysozyme family protein
MDAFDAAVALVLDEEGGYGVDRHDPGGATKFGISARAYPSLDIASLTRGQAKAIYRRDYWDRHRCGEMPWGWAVAVFDGAVNQGDAVAMAQRALRIVADGLAGPATLGAMAAARDDDLAMFFALRAERYVRERDFAVFGHGWMKRLFRVAFAGARPLA